MEKVDEADRLAGSGGRRTLLSHSHRYCRSLLTGRRGPSYLSMVSIWPCLDGEIKE